VRTGKYRPADEQNAAIRPHRVVDDVAQAVDELLKPRGR
jgi:hypothetical protein